MTQGVQDLIKAIDSGDSQAIDAAFQAEMANRISTRLEDMRVSVAKGMFATEQATEETIEEVSEEAEEAEKIEEDAEQIDEAQRIGRKADGSLGFMDDKKDAPIKDHHLAKDIHQGNLQKHLGNHTGDKQNTYFDGTDLVYGDKTVVRNASGTSSNHTVSDLKKALDKHIGKK